MKKFVLIGEEHAAAKILKALVDNEEVAVGAVFTDISKKSPIINIAKKHDLSLFDSSVLAEKKTLDWLKIQKFDWLINILSAVIIPEYILKLFPESALNLHTGPLPEYAGIHVHQWGIRNGETKFGVTIHQMETGIDTGCIVGEREFEITAFDTGLSLFKKAMKEGAELFQEILDDIVEGNKLMCCPQDLARRNYYSQKAAHNSYIDWSLSATEIINFVRAGNYYPFKSPTYTATIELNSKSIQLLKVEKSKVESGIAEPGVILGFENDGPIVACGERDSVIVTKAADDSGVISEARWKQYLKNSGRLIL